MSLLHHTQQVGNTRQPTKKFNIALRKGLFVQPQADTSIFDSDQEACPCETCECKAPLPSTASYSYPRQRRESTAGRVVMCRPRQAKPAEEHPGLWVDPAGESKAAQTDVKVKSQGCGRTVPAVPLRWHDNSRSPNVPSSGGTEQGSHEHVPQDRAGKQSSEDQSVIRTGQDQDAWEDTFALPDQKASADAVRDKTTVVCQRVYDSGEYVRDSANTNTNSSGRGSRHSLNRGGRTSSGSKSGESDAEHSRQRRSSRAGSTVSKRSASLAMIPEPSQGSGVSERSVSAAGTNGQWKRNDSVVAEKSEKGGFNAILMRGSVVDPADPTGDKQQAVNSSAATNDATAVIGVQVAGAEFRTLRSETDVDRPNSPVSRDWGVGCRRTYSASVDPPFDKKGVFSQNTSGVSTSNDGTPATPPPPPSSQKHVRRRSSAASHSKAYGARKQSIAPGASHSPKKSSIASRPDAVFDAYYRRPSLIANMNTTDDSDEETAEVEQPRRGSKPGKRRQSRRFSTPRETPRASMEIDIFGASSSISVTDSQISIFRKMTDQTGAKMGLPARRHTVRESRYVSASAMVLRKRSRSVAKPTRRAHSKMANKTHDASHRSNITLDVPHVSSGKALAGADASHSGDVTPDAAEFPGTGVSKTRDAAAASEPGRVVDSQRYKDVREKQLPDKMFVAVGWKQRDTQRRSGETHRFGAFYGGYVSPCNQSSFKKGSRADGDSQRCNRNQIKSTSIKSEPPFREYDDLQRMKSQGHATHYRSPQTVNIEMKRMFKKKNVGFELTPDTVAAIINKRDKAKGYLRKITHGSLAHAVEMHLRGQIPMGMTSRRDVVASD